ncbi:MAG: UvrD-helicase domain-containing protein [Candidatus Thioglobus sp.]|uniref:UvrD-helicase domain-containing protein n=1 Tax=Candidatus Thioglobus sp. TaxID=2026721 RepID=UPI002636AE98|nr:UvrD-helicase domain-containing protein [Candidatus Thioglobus sp.]MDC9726524.1 UvrD-helicase domain-containing protein [Candidatus Thioglobus sp.]
MDDQAQRLQALDTSRSFLIQAPAGSGKTELLTQRYLRLLAVSDSPEGVLAMTFTKKAVSELKARVIDALKAAKGERPEQAHKQQTYDLANEVLARSETLGWQLLEMPQRLKISTIDGLANLITTRYPRPGTWVNKKIITQTWQQEAIYLQAAKQTLLSIDTPDFAQPIQQTLLYLDNNVNRFYQLLTTMLAKRDQWLNKLYVKDVFNAQSLKTSANQIINQHLAQLLALAEAEFKQDFFEALSSNTQAEIAQINALPGAKSSDLSQWQSLADICLTAGGTWRKTLTKANGFPAELKAQKLTVLDVLSALSGQTELERLLSGVKHLPELDFAEDQIQALSNIAQVLKIAVAQLNILFEAQQSSDFIQVALDADQVLSDHGATDVALFLDYKIQHLLIDEFQDTSSTQFALIEKLIASWQPTDAKTIFLVGDPMQSIYLFRQSQVGLFLQVRVSGIANLNPEFLQLTTNFRSDKAVVETNNAYFSSIFPKTENAQEGAICYAHSSANLAATQQGCVKFYPLAHRQYAQEAQQVREIVEQNNDREVAILVRNRSHLSEIVPALKAAGIEFEALKTTPLKQASFTRDLIALSRAILSLGDKLAWLAVLRAPWCGLLLADILTIAEVEHQVVFEALDQPDFLQTLSSDGVNRAQALHASLLSAVDNQSRFSTLQRLEFAIQQLCPQQSLTEKQRMIKRQFLAIIHECEVLGQLNIQTINQQLDELYAPSTPSTVKLMTIHQAKGLEFDVVIIPGLGRAPRANQSPIIQLHEFVDQSLLLAPIKSYQAKNPSRTYQYLQQFESRQGHFESMRLLYVAMTRAKSDIHLLATLNSNNKASSNTFLKLLEPLLKHQFDAAPAVEEDLDVTPEALQLHRYTTPLTSSHYAHEAHEVANINNSIDLGYKSLLGTFVHQCFELDAFELDKDVLDARLIELGIATQALDSARQSVAQLLANTKTDANFDWLFKSRDSTQVEAEFSHQGKSVIIDRLFIDNDILWIIDFKTADLLMGESQADFIERQRQKHSKQLLFYKEVLSNNYTNDIKCALYCPSVQTLIEIV